ncbi:DUF550 domain-containing protein, partial [Escherichia coli]|nr:DUF550 domain-containing protein [Escherichia coli]
MSAITKERIKLFIKNPLDNGLTRGEQMELARIALVSLEREQIRHEHAKWSDSTFGCVGPIGPLKHLSKEALEAAAEPDDLSEWADMQFLLWDAQRRAGISDAEITAAMEDKLKINMERQWPEPKDGEPRLHIKEPGNYPVIPSEVLSAILKVAKIRADFDDFDGDRRGIGDCLDEAEQELIVTINKYASQLSAEPIATNDVREQTAVPPVPVIQADVAQAIEKLKRKLVECNRYNYCADAVNGVEDACHAAMLQGSQPASQTYKLPVNTPCQDAPAHIWLQTAGVWPEDGELSELTWCSHNQHHDDTLYVRADLVNGNSPVTPDAWISCSERMPDTKTAVLVAREFDRKGDWRMKWATYIPGHPDANDGWVVPGASWIPSHWMPLPEP